MEKRENGSVIRLTSNRTRPLQKWWRRRLMAGHPPHKRVNGGRNPAALPCRGVVTGRGDPAKAPPLRFDP